MQHSDLIQTIEAIEERQLALIQHAEAGIMSELCAQKLDEFVDRSGHRMIMLSNTIHSRRQHGQLD